MAEVSTLKAMRKAIGLTQGEFAAALGLTGRQFGDIENGHVAARPMLLLAAERLALAKAVELRKIDLAPASVRRDALELASLIRGEG